MSKLVVLDGHTLNPGDNPWTEVQALGELVVYPRTPRESVIERARGADVIFSNKTPLDAELLASLPGLRGICVLATGYNVVDVKAARANGIAVCNVPEYATSSVAQHTFAMLLELSNAVGAHDRAVHAGDWTSSPDFCFWRTPLIELKDLIFGIVGYGSIGQNVARIARAFGMVVEATPSRRPAPAEDEVHRRPLPELLKRADVISLHCPLTPETERLIRRETLSQMKPSSLLLNTGRGALIDEADLARALNESVIAGAALDVLSREPPPSDNPLLSAKNCLITPHIAWTSQAARRRVMAVSAQNARALLAGAPVNVVN